MNEGILYYDSESTDVKTRKFQMMICGPAGTYAHLYNIDI